MTTSSHRLALRLGLLAASALLGACPAPPAPGPDAGCALGQRVLDGGRCVPVRSCGQGFEADPAGAGCVEVRAHACDAGTMPVLGSTDCAPVGWTSCPQGFAPHASGWGCAPILPAAPCDAGTTERLGSTACVPLGDCAAPFPPAAATVFVDAALTSTDATHFTDLAAAVAAAPSGATVAVEAGRYTLLADLTVKKALTVVGRCAERVTVARGGSAIAGVFVSKPGYLHLSGMTLTGLDGAPAVRFGGKAVFEDVDINGGRWLGAAVDGAGSTLTLRRARVENTQPTPSGANGWGLSSEAAGAMTLEDVVVQGNLGNNVVARDASSTLTATRVLVRDGLQAPRAGVGVGFTAAFGAHLELHQCVVSNNRLRNLTINGEGTTVLVDESVLESAVSIGAQVTQQSVPASVFVEAGAKLTLSHSVLAGTAAQLSVADPGTSVQVTDSVLRDSLPETFSAAWAADGAHLELDRVAIVSAVSLGLEVSAADAVVARTYIAGTRLDRAGLYGVGLQVSEGGTLKLDGSALVGNVTVGLIVVGTSDAGVPSHAIATSSVFADTQTGKGGVAGHGVNVHSGGRLDLTACSLTGNHEAALSVAGGVVTVYDSVFRDTLVNGEGEFGHGIVGVPSSSAEHASSSLSLSNVSVAGNASVGLMAAGMAGTVQGSSFERNQTAVHVQDGTTLEQADTAPASPAPGQLVITSDTVFFGNATLTGTGTVPLPRSLTSL